MVKKRKTNADRREEQAEADRCAWKAFHPKLNDLKTYAEALELVATGPGPNDPGRRYYSNLAFFLQDFTVPFGSNYTEKTLYLQFIQNLDKAGALKPGVGKKIVEELKKAMGAEGAW